MKASYPITPRLRVTEGMREHALTMAGHWVKRKPRGYIEIPPVKP